MQLESNHKITKIYDVVIVGGGPSGLISAIFSASRGKKTVICERNGFCGKKLNITGKGRCNITNNCDNQTFLSNVTKNSKFLYKAISSFSTSNVMDYFESIGVPLKTERGNRVFPISDKAKDVTNALVREAKKNDVDFIFERVKKIKKIIDENNQEKFIISFKDSKTSFIS
ncbi:MAG: NAD(P)/FAD-dependent oxidoreductase, partial [Clostridia bacterium]|nr:NAD(P)/FAD-dependent oxidoreductase [Clostridia bacterium]